MNDSHGHDGGGEHEGDGHEGHPGGPDVAIDEGRPQLKEPTKYAVILHNDDFTTMEFVVDVLQRFFRKSEEEAVQITLQVHQAGKGLAGIFSHQIAETKVAQVTEYARQGGYPLRCTAEPV